jgi:hypothetical protein
MFEFILCISEASLCSMAALQIQVPLLLAELQLLTLLAGTLAYSEQKLFLHVIFCSGIFFTVKSINLFNNNIYIYIFLFTAQLLARLYLR